MAFSFCPQTDPVKGQRGIDKVHEPGEGGGGGRHGGEEACRNRQAGFIKRTKQQPGAYRRHRAEQEIKGQDKADRRSMK